MMYRQNLTTEDAKFRCEVFGRTLINLFNKIIKKSSTYNTYCDEMQSILNKIIYYTKVDGKRLTIRQLIDWFFTSDGVDITDDYEQFVLKLIENYNYCVDDALILVLNNQRYKISEFADSQQSIIANCTNLGTQFAHHFNKIMDEGTESQYFSYHCNELQNFFNQINNVKFKHNNKRLTIENLIDWFFTAGQNIEDVVKEQYVDAYDELLTYLVSHRDNFNIKEIMTELCNR